MMKKKNMILTSILIGGMIIAVVFATKNKVNAADKIDWNTNAVTIDGTSYQFDDYFTQMKQNGWTLDGKDIPTEDNVWFHCTSDTNNECGFYVQFNDDGALSAVSVNGFLTDEEDSQLPDIQLAGNISLNCSMNTVEAIYGEADVIEEGENQILQYTAANGSLLSLNFTDEKLVGFSYMK